MISATTIYILIIASLSVFLTALFCTFIKLFLDTIKNLNTFGNNLIDTLETKYKKDNELTTNTLVFQMQLNNKKLLYEHSDDIIKILDRAKDMAYEKIKKEDIIKYLTNNEPITNKESEIFARKYIKLCIDLIGPNIKKDLAELYGNLDSVVSILYSDFILKLSEDELMYKLLPNNGNKDDINVLLRNYKIGNAP